MCLLGYSVMGAETPEFTFRHYSAKDGLSSNAVISMLQDSYGLMWMGTTDGLNSFDGRSFTRYPLPEKGSNGTINCIKEDSSGMLWIGTDDALYRFDRRTFTRIENREGGESPTSIVSSIAEDGDGNIWISTRDQAVFCHVPSTGETRHYQMGEDVNFELIFVDSNNLVWAAPAFGNKSLYLFNRADNVFQPVKLNFTNCRQDRICAIEEDASGDFWMATWSSGLYNFNPTTREVTAYTAGGIREGFNHAHSLRQVAPLTFLIGSDDGLLWYNVATGEHRLYINEAADNTSLSSKFVYPIVRDREGGIWIGTYYGGADYVSTGVGQFTNWSMTALTGGTEGYTVSCFHEDPDGTVWVGSDNGGLMHFDPASGKAIDYYTPTHKSGVLGSLNVHSLFRDGDYLWVGTYAGGLGRIDLRTGKTRTFSYHDGLNNSSIYAIARDRNGTLWVATMFGLHIYDPAAEKFNLKLSLDVNTTQIVETSDGRLWFATSGGGIYVHNPNDSSWRNITTDTSNLSDDFINHIFRTSDDLFLISHKSGLDLMDTSTGEIRKLDVKGERDISFAVPYGNQVWLSTPRGLIRCELQDGSMEYMEYYDSTDGIECDQFLPASGMLTSDGWIYVGATSGFVSFYPYRMARNSYIPPVLLSDFKVRGPRSDNSVAEYVSIPVDKPISLNYKNKDIVIGFSALSYSAPEKNSFMCRLDGIDNQWRSLGNQNWIEYINLPAGKYTFRVKASNNDGVWNEDGATLSFTIKPHPLASNIAIILYTLLGFVGVYFLVRYLIRRYEIRYKEKYDRMLAQRREEDLNMKVNFVTNIAHEIRTPLSLITAPLERIKSRQAITPAPIKSDLAVIDKNSQRLLMLVNQILDFSRIDSETLNVRHPEYRSIPMIVRQVIDTFVPTLETRGIAFSYDAPKDDFKGDVDEESLIKIVTNLMSNALKYTSSEVSVTLTRGSDTYSVKVCDNGPGISEDVRAKVFTPFYRIDESKQGTGLGLAIVRRLVEIAMGKIEVRDAAGGGSEFVVEMPLTAYTASRVQSAAENAAEPAEKVQAPVQITEEPGSQPVMLIVEDDSDLLEFLADDFGTEYTVLKACDGTQAVSLLESRAISIVITDWMMPKMQGDELCRYIRSHSAICHIPTVMLTAKSDDSSMLASMNCGADAYVKKPFSVEHMHALARHLLSIRDMLARKYSGEPMAKPADINAMSNDSFLSKLSEIIDANIANSELSVAMLASEMCVSRSGLFAKVKEASGDTPNNLIINARLKAAAKLLDEGKYPVNEICYMVGFNSPSYFSRTFGKYYGLTPHQWVSRPR